ncbi:hypothetical protein A0J61_00932 [Choanephora cucurbitarum]|uniref:Uncharacterized protein n=1 Tax=Choanephora cucurbitarum TaxID=101091 RepID=A0A1C7NPT7_9FUNG|nr:hypothetical protein A0J61_00932 [Choanephora cucurbitarum]
MTEKSFGNIILRARPDTSSSYCDDFQTPLPIKPKKQETEPSSPPSLPSTSSSAGTSTARFKTPTSLKSRKVQAGIDKPDEIRVIRDQEQTKSLSSSVVCKTCEVRHARSSSSQRRLQEPNKREKFKYFISTSVIKTNLNNVCQSEEFIKKLQDIVAHINQLVYAGAMFVASIGEMLHKKLEIALENLEESPSFGLRITKAEIFGQSSHRWQSIILSVINTNNLFVKFEKLENCHQKDALPAVEASIQEIQTKISQEKISPLKYIDTHGTPFVSLLPLHGCTPKHIRIKSNHSGRLPDQ